MAALAWTLALILGSILCALLFFDLSPRAAAHKFFRRLLNKPQGLDSARNDAPYRRAAHPAPFQHPTLLNLETSDGSGQACHPDVLYVPQGFGAMGWQFWMACTPYPYANSSFENPEIFASQDGVSWTVPSGLKNPIITTPGNDGSHNSDPDLILHGNELWLYFRETLRSKNRDDIPDKNRIFLTKTADGIHWSRPLAVLSDVSGRQLLSPSVVHDCDCFRMWTVETNEARLHLVQRVSRDGFLWSDPQRCDIAGLARERQPWHIDVVREGESLRAILVSCTGLGGRGSRIHYAQSDDDGQSWLVDGFLLEQAYEFESKLQYRGSLQPLEGRPSEYGLWYSAQSKSGMFSIAYIRMRLDGGQLVPASLLNSEKKVLIAAK